jgi:SAM-dependent methyltransferase
VSWGGAVPENGWRGYFDATASSYDAEEYAQPWEQEAAFYLDVLGLAPGGRVLDLGCGTGSHAVATARRGFRVVGVDLSAGMLARAQAKARAVGVGVDWIQADLVRFATLVRFDGALCVLEAAFGFMTSADDPTAHELAILRNVHACLRPGARFLLGAANGYKAIREYTQADVASGRFDPATMIQEHELAWTEPDGAERRVKVRHRPYLPPEIAALMERAGLQVEHVWGGTRGRGARHVDGVRPAVHRDAHEDVAHVPVLGGEARGLVAEDQGRRPGQLDGVDG